MMKYSQQALIAIILLIFQQATTPLIAQVREKQTINSGWDFVLNDAPEITSVPNAKWQRINLPHTWNALDIIDDTIGYHQGVGWYKKDLFIPAAYANKHTWLFFEGACNKVQVYVNGKKSTTHIGGFTGFDVNLDGMVKYGEKNQVVVMVDNSKSLSDSVPPFSADFNVLGGIYRDVWLMASSTAHFSKILGSDAIYFETPSVTEQLGNFKISGNVDGANMGASIGYELKQGGIVVKSGTYKTNIQGDSFSINSSLGNPKLWSPENPNLYLLTVFLLDEKKQTLDEVVINVGFRWFGINDKKEFTLNGKPYKLKGAARHQDFERIGNALTDPMHERDITLMKEMGCNFLRIAHYPQDPAVCEACNRLGLIVWSEIPVVDKVVNNATFLQNTLSMVKEMVLQNFNHPSVAIWGYHNEVRNLEEVSVSNARLLDSTVRKTDLNRLTAIAFESNTDLPYFNNPLLKDILNIADINGYNIYQGWYRGTYKTIGNFLDSMYALNPAKPIFLSEYGAGSMVNLHAYKTSIFDFSEEYQLLFNEHYLKAGMQRPWMIGFSIWNFIDFQRDGREDVMPNINNKGMVTTDRKPKDVYYYYKSQWAKDPFVYITGKNWPQRIAITGKEKTINVPLVVYSNQQNLRLLKNGKPIATKYSNNGKFEWVVALNDGNNQLECGTLNGGYKDVINIHYSFIDSTSFSKRLSLHQLNFNTGQTNSFFTDAKSNELWIPDKPYTKGTWGYIGGKAWNTWSNPSWNNLREGIEKPIANTENEPLFQTFIEDVQGWRADVPSGKYRVTLLLAEPFKNTGLKNGDRILNIYLNGHVWVENLNIAKDYGVQSAVIIDKEIVVKDKEGIQIDFAAKSGKTLLNGVKLIRIQ